MSDMRSLPVMSRLGVVFLTWRRHLENGVRSCGITLKQLHVLRHLEKSEYVYPSEIADMLFCDRPTATVVINNLKKKGLLCSVKDTANGRRQKVMLTPAGIEKLHETQRRPEEAVNPLVCFTDEEQAEFERLLKKLHRHLKACGL